MQLDANLYVGLLYYRLGGMARFISLCLLIEAALLTPLEFIVWHSVGGLEMLIKDVTWAQY